jgi:hypothetical protein
MYFLVRVNMAGLTVESHDFYFQKLNIFMYIHVPRKHVLDNILPRSVHGLVCMYLSMYVSMYVCV